MDKINGRNIVMESYDKIKKTLAIAFMHDLDANRPEGKMCLSNGECADIEKAFNEQDWPRLAGYLDKYTESEDERIRKAIISLVHENSSAYKSFAGIDLCDMLSWLEKQKEQECPGEANDDALQTQLQIWFEKGKCSGRDEVVRTPEKYGLQKPMEWSEEDEKMRSRILDIFACDQKHYLDETAWLQSLRPSWKPSEEQIQALLYAVSSIPPNYLKEQDYTMKLIGDVIQQLKKL